MSVPKTIRHSGSSLDSFLEEENLLEQAESVAAKRVIAWQIQKAMAARRVTKQAMAKRLKTSRSQIDRLLDPGYLGISLDTMSRAAHALGKRIHIHVVEGGTERRIQAAKPNRRFRAASVRSRQEARVAAV